MVSHGQATVTDPRVVRSHAAVLEAATELFLRDGYPGTTMDAIADAAGVSKRTVYNNFEDKRALFREVVMAATGVAEQFATEAGPEVANAEDLRATLTSVARRQLSAATSPAVIRLRRLLIGEAHRFPDLAAEYYSSAPGRVISALATAFGRLSKRGLLRKGDPVRTAEHFAFLVLGASLDRALFEDRQATLSPAGLNRAAADGVRAFLAAYGND